MIAVVVLTYRPDPGVLERCVASVIRSGDADAVVVVDNGGHVSRDRLLTTVGAETGPDTVPTALEVLTPGDNLGYAGGMNVGIARAATLGARAVALLNDDTCVGHGWLTALAAVLDPADRIGAAQPKLLFADRDPPIVNSMGVTVESNGCGVDIGYGEPDDGRFDTRREIDVFTGGAVLLAADFLVDTGGFDERYFLYYEDVDLARRGSERGWRYVVEPKAVVWHIGRATTSREPSQYRFWQERNRLWCAFRHGSPPMVARALGRSLLRWGRHPRSSQGRAILAGLAGARRGRSERRRGITRAATEAGWPA
ncbi:glycosyltransferase family 2 protein [soil metagenome]